MERRVDDLSFEGAWKNQIKEEKKDVTPKEEKEVKVHDAPKFRGQRDVVEKRSEIKMTKKEQPEFEKKHATVVSELSSKQGDDFDVEW